jgi:hypothetical protein
LEIFGAAIHSAAAKKYLNNHGPVLTDVIIIRELGYTLCIQPCSVTKL